MLGCEAHFFLNRDTLTAHLPFRKVITRPKTYFWTVKIDAHNWLTMSYCIICYLTVYMVVQITDTSPIFVSCRMWVLRL